MKNKLGMLLTLGALVILVGAGCAKTSSPTVEDQQKVESSDKQIVNTDVGNKTKNEVDNKVESENTSKPVIETKPSTPVTPADIGKSMLTVGEVAKHNTSANCYIVVRDSVYDVTKFIPNHPGGPERIIPLCGKDATSAFTGQHSGQPQPEAALASFKIGALQK
jgi:cytochrome b involved in lipid metabolism